MNENIFRQYDIRGIWEKDFDERFCFNLGRAFAIYTKGKLKKDKLSISVGYDARLSNKTIFKHLSDGLNAEGVRILNLGLVPTPVAYFSLFRLDIDGNIMITASHNPKEYNGFKLSCGQDTLFGGEILKIRDIIMGLRPHNVVLHEYSEDYDILSEYKNFMINQFGYLRYYEDSLKPAIDGGNGVAGFVAYDIMKTLGFDVKGIFLEPDGTFPNHHPDPTIEKNISDLKTLVMEKVCNVGIGYDGDGDRIGVVLKNGRMLYGDMLLLFFSQDLVRRHKAPKIIGDVKCSNMLFSSIKKGGGIPVMWKSGHSLIKSKMKEIGAYLAGEMSGHIFFSDRYFGYDDAIYASLRLLEILRSDNVDMLEWYENLPGVFNTPEIKVNCDDEKKEKVISKITHYLKEHKEKYNITKINTIDGVRFDAGDGWGLIRKSNTQPAIILRFESPDESALNEMSSMFLLLLDGFVKKT